VPARWNWLAVARVLMCVGALAAPPAGFAGAAWGSTPAQIVAAVNAERATNLIPAGIVVNDAFLQGCQQLDLYEHENGDNFVHSESPSDPGYTALGDKIARGGTDLDIGGAFGGPIGWSEGAGPFEDGPMHLFSLLYPSLGEMGADDSYFQETPPTPARPTLPGGPVIPGEPGSGVETMCLTTRDGYDRPRPSVDTVSTYPGDGATIYPSEEDIEAVSSPSESGPVTGPYLLVFALAPSKNASVTLLSASLTGPGGPVSVRIGTRYRAGGWVVPVDPLADMSTYRARVTLDAGGATVVHSWSFHTNSAATDATGATGLGTTTIASPSASALFDELNASQGGLRFRLRCTIGPCRIHVVASTVERLAAGGGRVVAVTAARQTRSVSVAEGSFSAQSAETDRIAVSLNAAGRQLLARFHALPIVLTVTLAGAHGHQQPLYRGRRTIT
jgi:hypothetical protein